LNNDLNPSGSGNTGSGGFVSGEVEDYVVQLGRTNLGAGRNGMLIRNVGLFPNPTEGRATVVFDAPRPLSHVDLTVRTLTGQKVVWGSYDHVGSHFITELDLSGKAKGVYFVELQAEGGEKVTRKLILQ
jgi:hypothetical protein